MANSIDRLVTQIQRVVQAGDSNGLQVEYGNWVSAEEVDENLSVITLNGKTIRFVPKMKNVVDLEPNEIVLVMSGNGMLKTIVGVHSGDVTLASEEE